MIQILLETWIKHRTPIARLDTVFEQAEDDFRRKNGKAAEHGNPRRWRSTIEEHEFSDVSTQTEPIPPREGYLIAGNLYHQILDLIFSTEF